MKKIIILVLIGVIGLAGILTASLMYSRAKATETDAVKRFYTAWIAASEIPGGAYRENLHEKSTYKTDELTSYVNRNVVVQEDGTVVFDPILCGATAVGEPGYNLVYNEDGRSRFILQNISPYGVINVYLIDEQGWRIDEIECPEIPEEALATSTPTAE